MNDIEIKCIAEDGNLKVVTSMEQEQDAADDAGNLGWIEGSDDEAELGIQAGLGGRLRFGSPVDADDKMECQRFEIIKIDGWPEVKTEMGKKCWRVFGKRMCTKIPRLYRRSSELSIYVEVCVPSTFEDGIKKVVKKCAIAAAVDSVAAALASGTAGAIPAFGASFVKCLKSQIGPDSDLIDYKISSEKKAGKWHPV